MRSNKRFLCLLLAAVLLACTLCVALADGDVSNAKKSAKEEKTVEAPEAPEATPEPTKEPREEEPTPEPTEEPAEESETLSKLTLRIASPSGLTQEQGAYVIDTTTVQSITLKWKYSGKCDGYSIRVTNAQGAAVYTDNVSKKKLELPLAQMTPGQYTITVSAMNGDKELVSATLSVMLSAGGGGFGGFGGGFGGKFGGGSGQGAQVEQGFHVTPGTALTSAHSAGDKSMNLYGAVELDADGETPMTALTLSDTALDIALSDGGEFTALAGEAALTLTPVGDAGAWTLNGYALKTLALSGVDTLSLTVGNSVVDFPTAPALTGDAYGALSAGGYVSRDYTYNVSNDGVSVSVGGNTYRLTENGELIPTEGQ